MNLKPIKLDSTGLKFKTKIDDVHLEILDQRFLPDEEKWVSVKSSQEMCELIQSLAVRGAPLIGVAAALALVVEAGRLALDTDSVDSKKFENLKRSAAELRAARPTAVNLMWAMDRMLNSLATHGTKYFLDEAIAIFNEDVEMCSHMGDHGASLIKDGDGVLTICNTGGLATVGIGTAFAVFRRAFERGTKFHVYACETRPLLQGARLTTWELARHGIPHTLITDSMAATLMRAGRVQSVFSGADRVAANGDFANKIGTYSLAVLAKHHGLPFYPVAPMSTVDARTLSGADIEIEQRTTLEVRGYLGAREALRWAPRNVEVFNPSFDMTPGELVTKYVLNRGLFSRDEFSAMIKRGV